MNKATCKESEFGDARLFTLKNANGMEVQIMNYGGTVKSIKVPDKDGTFDDVVLGFDHFDEYLKHENYFGAIVGRYANRISNARFDIEGKTYNLSQNNGANHLHGGEKGFDKQFWDVIKSEAEDGYVFLFFKYRSPDLEGGFPGNLNVQVNYILTPDNELAIYFGATTDKPTHCNLTNHSYFNLAGAGNGDVLGHMLKIMASDYIPVNENLIPKGIEPVKNTPFDFTKLALIGSRINKENDQLKLGNGYDHNFVLDNPSDISEGLTPDSIVAKVIEPESGRTLEVKTTEPGLQFYTANHLKIINGKNGKQYSGQSGFCLEPQHFPDSPNQPDFPTTLLMPDELYETITSYKFGVRG